MSLPEFVAPMMARLGQVFDSANHSYELKWDGMRTMVHVEPQLPGGYRLRNRQRRDVTDRYPEQAALSRLPVGTVIDGELCVLADGRPSFRRLMSREQLRDPGTIRTRMARDPVTFVVFDICYHEQRRVMDWPLVERRHLLQQVIGDLDAGSVLFSAGLSGGDGAGQFLFEQACAMEIEGVVAKRLDSAYRPGQRTDAWIKIKRTQRMHCLILGYLPADRPGDFKSLVLAAPDADGQLVGVGRVGSGIGDEARAALLRQMDACRRATPLIPVDEDGVWIEPGLYCTVTFLERTENGSLRAPVFVGLAE